MADRQPESAGAKPALRRDAQRNLEKLTTAAVDVFGERGLGAPLEEIAQRAGVSIGTLYNRFATREALIDAVIPELAATRLGATAERARACADPWEGFVLYVEELGEMQAGDPTLNDVISRRFPYATRLMEVCDIQLAQTGHIIERAQRNGSLRADFVPEDMPLLIWSTAAMIHAAGDARPDIWRRGIRFILDGLRADAAAHPLPVGPMTVDQLHRAMRQDG
ncbi:TetR/AcrR family transcriptional regulator [Streptomyces sp. NPDC060223]|uniref:TetR/AcrR family transcriptional regulator n=1 Tax=unclassified Streptomyces TaxID=2593676 RepID=UPI00364012CA